MKRIYELAEMEISVFECEDMITTSGLSNGGEIGDDNKGPVISWDDFINGGK